MTTPSGSLLKEKNRKSWEVKLMAPWFNQLKVSPGVEIRGKPFLLLLLHTLGGTCSSMTCWKLDLHLCSFVSWLPASLPEPWLLQSATYLCVPLRLPGAPLWGGGSRAGVHPRWGQPEACSTRDKPFPERPTTEKALREGYRCHQGPDPTTCDHQTACPHCVSVAAALPLLIIACKSLHFAK